MGLRKGTPGEGAETRSEQFSYVKTPHGAKPWFGWMACDPYWCKAHTSDAGTKPCLHWITHGVLPCPRCSPVKKPVDLAYVGLYRESDLKPCVVIVHDSTADLLDGLEFGVHVQVHREHGDTSSVAVRRALSQPLFRSKIRSRQKEADLTLSLLTMWKINELSEWYHATNGEPHHTTPKPKDAAKADTSPRVSRIPRSKYPEKSGAELTPGEAIEASRVFDYILEREAKPNGKKKPEE